MVTVSNNVIILARTRMNNEHVCVGGFDVDNNRYIRLLTANAEMPNEDVSYQVGQSYSLKYENRYRLVLPHCEDVCVYESELISHQLTNNEFNQILRSLVIRNIHIRDLFDGLLHWENCKGFLLENDDVLPDYSVMIVTLNHDLFLSRFNERQFYYKDSDETFAVPYIGVDDFGNLQKIAAGTFLRFSLARWWNNNGRYPIRRSYLQLSAIYEI